MPGLSSRRARLGKRINLFFEEQVAWGGYQEPGGVLFGHCYERIHRDPGHYVVYVGVHELGRFGEREESCAHLVRRRARTASRLEQAFRTAADKWKAETLYLSSLHRKIAHPSYLEIIAMGRSAVPFILKALQDEPDDWFAALQAIAGEDPVPPEDEGDIEAMTNRWLSWAREHNLA